MLALLMKKLLNNTKPLEKNQLIKYLFNFWVILNTSNEETSFFICLSFLLHLNPVSVERVGK